MSLPELIREYHSRKLLPVFNKAAHELFFREYVDGYSSDGLPALERFASNSGFKIIIEDFDFRYVSFRASVLPIMKNIRGKTFLLRSRQMHKRAQRQGDR
jgi:hypothetical protein